MITLGIETSCDETAVAIFDSDKGLIGESVFSQIDLHSEYGGVIPELASRDHCKKIIQIYKHALGAIDPGEIDYVAYTAGPGLLGALLIGENFAQGLALSLNKPLIPVNHLEAHLMAPFLDEEKVEFPFLTLLVSGGHSLIIDVQGLNQYEILGQSRDDAVGEAFDKVAKMLGLSYPGGPAIAKIAVQGTPGRFKFPRPMTNKPGLNFSFSGLKTFTLNTVNDLRGQSGRDLSSQEKADIAFAFQDAVVDTIRIKCERAMEQTGLDRLILAGGVSANIELRARLKQSVQKHHGQVFYPPLNLCTDNGAMIAYAGYLRLQHGHQESLSIEVRPRWPMSELNESELNESELNEHQTK